MRNVLIIFSIAFFLCLSCIAQAGPFGTEMGQKPEQFTGLKKVEVTGSGTDIYTLYTTDTLPKTNPLFESYTLLFGKNGLAKVIATGKTYANDSYGNQVQEEYSTLKEQLTKKYGKPKSYDFLEDGSIWNKSKDFVMAVYRGERVLAAFWKTNLPDNIAAIGLNVKGVSPLGSYLSLTYEYKNFEAIAEEIKKAAEDAL